MRRQPCRQGFRESPYETNGRRPGILKPFDNLYGSVCRLLDDPNGYRIFRRRILKDQRRKLGIVGRSRLRSKTNDPCRIPLETIEYGCRKLCFVGSTIKRPKCAAQRFPTYPLAACLVGYIGTISANGDALSINYSQTTRTGAQYHDAPVTSLVGAKPGDVSIGLKHY